MDVKLSTENIRAIVLFEKVTHVSPKDCLIAEHALYFLVEKSEMGMAIGKDGVNIKQLRRIAGKHIKIFAYADTAEEFLKNVIPTLKSLDVQDGVVSVTVPQQDKLTVIGKAGENINAIRAILKRHFGVETFKLR
ncbi:MAG: NusA-like transcription termination signal-binding factor [Candidatus Aenigmarchaeota archaeon]|nr:NusA-like transcription termination signal-binding factor [Candidatus Aenigmarchaeota archaeon]